MPWIIFVIITLVNALVSKSFSNLIACFPLGWEVLYSGVLAAEWVDHLFPCKIFLPIECPVSFIYQYEYIIWYSMILFVRWMPQVLKKWKLRGHFSQDVIGCKTQVAFINSDCSALMPRMNKGNRWQQTLRNSSEKEQVYSGVFRPQYFLTFQVSRTGKKTKGLMSIWDPVFYHHKTLVHHTRKRHFKNSTIYLRLFKQLWQAWSSLSEGIMLTITSTYNRQENDKTNIKILCN